MSSAFNHVRFGAVIFCAYFFTLCLILRCLPVYQVDVGNASKQQYDNKSASVPASPSKDTHKVIRQPDKNNFKKIKGGVLNHKGKFMRKIDANTAAEFSNEDDNNFYKINAKVFTYSAFYDNRTGNPFIRIIATVSKRDTVQKDQFWCHFVLPDDNIEISYTSTRLIFYEMCENHKRTFGGWILTCNVPVAILHVPKVVMIGYGETNEESISRSKTLYVKSRNSNIVRRKLKFGVCVPPLYGSIKPNLLIEFIEFNRVLGADMFTIYVEESDDRISESVEAVLRYYEGRNIVTVIRWRLPFKSKYIWYHGQSLSINDCLYRNMFDFQYLTFLDIDEFLVPHSNLQTWNDIISVVANDSKSLFSKVSGLIFKSVLFSKEFSRDVYAEEMVVNVRTNRTRGFSFFRNKAIVRPERVFEMGIHHLSRSWPDRDNYSSLKVNTDIAHIHHYRVCKPEFGVGCKSWIEDMTVPVKFGKIIIDNFLRTMFDITP